MTDVCQIIPFPLKARVAKIRRVAEVLRSTPHQPTRDSYWLRTIGQLREKLKDLGLDDKQIREEIGSFKLAVQHQAATIDQIETRASDAPDGAA
jgi:hypothetical protein